MKKKRYRNTTRSMKAVLFLLISFSFGIYSYGATPAEGLKRNMLTTLVSAHQTEAMQKFGRKIQLVYSPANIVQLTGGHIGPPHVDAIQITVYAGALAKFDQDQLLASACHELGHILGSVPLSLTHAKTDYDKRDSVEGEADYYGGGCLVDFIAKHGEMLPYDSSQSLENNADAFAESMLKVIYTTTKVSSQSAVHKVYKGINASYPELACRLLSFQRGAVNAPRPSCWYNP